MIERFGAAGLVVRIALVGDEAAGTPSSGNVATKAEDDAAGRAVGDEGAAGGAVATADTSAKTVARCNIEGSFSCYLNYAPARSPDDSLGKFLRVKWDALNDTVPPGACHAGR